MLERLYADVDPAVARTLDAALDAPPIPRGLCGASSRAEDSNPRPPVSPNLGGPRTNLRVGRRGVASSSGRRGR